MQVMEAGMAALAAVAHHFQILEAAAVQVDTPGTVVLEAEVVAEAGQGGRAVLLAVVVAAAAQVQVEV